MTEMDKLKSALIEKIKLMAEQSTNATDEELIILTAQIVGLSQCLLRQLESDAKTWHPLYGWLTKKDLEDLRIEREENSRRLDDVRKKLGVQVRHSSEC